MKTIWKYPLQIIGRQVVEMPLGAEILTAQMQGAQLCLWAIVRPELAITHQRTIWITGTGNPLPNETLAYIATVQEGGGALVWHVFEQA